MYVRALTDEERTRLEAALRSSSAFTLRRAQIVLASVRKESPAHIAASLGYSAQTVRNAIHAFEADPLPRWCGRSSPPIPSRCVSSADESGSEIRFRRYPPRLRPRPDSRRLRTRW